ncbi:hypothetical protein BROUX41_002231 [Berkeleyomyces rouxiae]|uniref:uncharacterized protein n=1 Tax=Berkeleyomyces rouxiae TaxID=2035830 RepID=UPI003B816E1C
MTPPTILSLKQSFIAAQTRLLASDPTPSTEWLDAQAAAPDALPARAVDDALFRLSHVLTQHSRRVHAPQASRHVAEQLDRLYWQATERGASAADGDGVLGDGIGRYADISSPTVITNLPPTWPQDAQSHAHPAESQRYAALTESLTQLDHERAAVLARVQRLRRIRASLVPLQPITKRVRENSSGKQQDAEEEEDEVLRNAVQENLVARNGAMEKEMERMRVLLARVGGRVARLEEGKPDDAVQDVEEAERRKVDALLDTL